jgi:aminomethyltransferase
LLAVQGRESIERLGLVDAPAFTHAMGALGGVEVMVCRTGYTGERGVELMCAAEDATLLWDAVVGRGARPCGLGARDTLRLEVCYPLHGNDIDEITDAISAGLGWTCALEKDFTGAPELRRIKQQGPARRLVAFVMEEKAIPRQGMSIDGGGNVTSGTHSPSLDVGIGMGYVPVASAAPDEQLTIDVRGKPRRARVVKKPIYSREDS